MLQPLVTNGIITIIKIKSIFDVEQVLIEVIKPGDTVLFSCGGASFNDFKNYQGITFYFKKNDKSYTIAGIVASNYYPNDFQNCLNDLKKMITTASPRTFRILYF